MSRKDKKMTAHRTLDQIPEEKKDDELIQKSAEDRQEVATPDDRVRATSSHQQSDAWATALQKLQARITNLEGSEETLAAQCDQLGKHQSA